MRTMCQACGSEQTKLGIGGHCKICNRSFCQECEKSDNPSFLNGGHQDWCCKSCMDKYGREALIPDGMNLNTTLLSPALSLSSYGSCVSSNGDISAEVNSKIRLDGDDVLDAIKKHPNLEISAHSEEQGDGSLFKTTTNQFSDAKISSGGMSLPMSTEEMCSSDSLTIATHRDSNSENVELHNSTLGDVQFIEAGDDSDGPENAIDSSPSFVSNMDTDPLVWIPPEPEDMEDEMESVANNDDDDDYSDGTQWGQPSSLSFLNEDHGKSHGYKEERQKAMVEAMNGQFKILASRFLASEGIPPDGEDVESWLNIVASLSWETALLVKPDASEGRAMDPGSYVKVKCIASGARHQSQVIKGLVFKKSTAHKHMPTKFRNPRLLLLQGALGHSAAGLSSFDSMVAEKDYLKSIIEMIEACHPNVVLVEKSVSRDIQESLLEKGITLFFDMKLPRLERIARCTGSKIISSADILIRPKLRQCDSFRIEKFVEEHNSAGEGGKRPTKTLMFLEGCPKPLGCTILLKGAHSEELKKVKRVMHYTVFAAYHLILETSFFADQRAFFMDMSTVREGNGTSIDKRVPVVSYGATPDLITSDPEGSEAGAAPQKHALDILISDGSFEKSVHEVMQFNSIHDAQRSSLSPVFSSDINSPGDIIMHNNQFCVEHNKYEMCQSDASVQPLLPGQLLSSVSASLKKFLGDSLPPRSSESMSSYISFNEKVLGGQNIDGPVSLPLDAPDNVKEISEKSNQEPDVGTHMAGFGSDLTKAIEQCSNGVGNKVQIQNKDEIESVLDPQSILVLFSSQCITKQIVCEQSHLSRIKYYGNFDTSLGRFLRDILLNQKHCCSSCGEPPESHVYWYTHQHGNLTVLVRRLPRESSLPGEAEGKIWMWTRCLKCERESGIPRSTRRVVMSSAARGLSFGKFLELSFSSHSANNRLSRCGHSLHRDSLRFFGLGSNVAMFRYSSVEIYDVCKPPLVLEFYSPTGHEWLKKEARDVFVKGDLFFTEVANILQKLKPRFSRSLLEKFMKLSYSVKEFCEVEEMLMQEKAEFEDFLMKAINHCGQLGDEILGIHWLKQELLLELYIWERRLHSIMSCTKEGDTSDDAINEQRSRTENETLHDKYVEESMTENGGSILEAPNQIPVDPVESSSCGNHQGQKLTILETGLGIESAGSSGNTIAKNHDSFEVDITEVGCLTRENSSPSMTEEHLVYVIDQDNYVRSSSISSHCEEENIPILDHIQEDHSIPVTTENMIYVEGVSKLEPQTDKAIRVDEVSSKEQHPNGHVSQELHDSKLEDPEGWIWAPFSQLRSACRKDLHGGFLQKFEFINSYTPSYLSPMHQLITDGTDSLHFPIGPGGNVMSISGDDISSIIACALALSEDPYGLTNNTIEKEGEGKGEADRAADNSCTLTMDGSVPSSYWSSIGSSEYEGIRASQSFSSFSSDELSTSGSDGLFVDRLIASEDRHPEIPVGSTKVAGKSKYSVICIHAKQFYALRKRCCPSEMAYISSLNRCKKWDAQGGKSKAFFAKSMDDRFIIKQIKKTELDSFLKFAPDYFKHISLSLDSGSQTCLAKILGIYQVRQNKSGKEVKIDLMVMENLLFGRNISRTYDLKGAVFSRYVKDSNDPDKVLLDQNFVEDMRISPIYIGGKTKHLLQRAIWNDTSFLTSINVMDYSLLVGVDRQRRELVFGIIDYLRQYTWDKQLETWVKASLVVPKNSLPTVISPKEYKKRFRKFMTKYFLTVPDSWCSERCSGPCKFCIGGCGSSKIHSAMLSEKSIEACA